MSKTMRTRRLVVIRRSERGAALLLVSVLMVIVLVGGLAAVAVTSGELASARGYRARQVAMACAEAGLAQVRATIPDVTNAKIVDGTFKIGAVNSAVRYRAGHYDTGNIAQDAVSVLDPSSFDAAALLEGENITNNLGLSGGVGEDGSITDMAVLGVTSTCGGSGYGAREMEMVFLWGTPTATR